MKKAVSMFLVLAMMVASLTACGSNDNAGSTAEGNTSNAGESQESGEGDVATFKIGGIGPITGGAAYYGLEVQQGAQIALDEINAAGGINGAIVEMQMQDDEADAEKAVNAYNALKDWGVNVLMGTVTSDACIAVAAETAADNMYQLTPSGSAVACVANPNAFQVCFSDPNQGIASARYIADNNVASKVAVIYDSSNSYSTGIYENFATEAAAQGIEIVSAEAFTADSKTDFSVQLQAAKTAGAELVFLPIYYQEASIILKQASDMQYAPTFFGCDGLDGILGVDGFDTSLAEGVMLLTPFAADDTAEATQSFVSKYQEAYGAVPSQFAADAYDAIYIIKAAAEAAGVTPDMSISDICDAMVAAMTEIEVEGITSVEGVPMTWSAEGTVEKAPKAVVITDGAYKAM